MSEDGKNVDVKVRVFTEGITAGMNQAAAQVKEGVGQIKLEFEGLGSAIDAIKGPFLAFTAILGGGELFEKLIDHTKELGVELIKSSEKTGMTVEDLSRLRFAAGQVAVSTESVQKGMQKLALSMEMAEIPTSLSARAYQALGIATKDAEGRLRPIKDVLGDVADKFSKMENGSTKTALAMNLLGRAGADLVPLLNQGRAGIKEMGDEADRLGVTMSTDTAQKAEDYERAMLKVEAVGQGVTQQIGAALMPVLADLANAFTENAGKGGALDMVLQALGGTIRVIGAMIIGLKVAFDIAFESGKFVFEELGTFIGGIAAAISEAMHGNLSGAKAAMAATSADMQKTFDATIDAIVAKATTGQRALLDVMGLGDRVTGPDSDDGGKDKGPAIGDGHTKKPKAGKEIKLPHFPDIGKEIEKIWKDQEKVADTILKSQRDHASAGVAIEQDAIDQKRALGQISDAEALQATRDLMDREFQIKRTALMGELDLAKDDVVKQAQIKAELLALDDAQGLALQKNTDATTLAIKAKWEGVFSSITTAVQTSVNGIIQGTQSLGGALRQMGVSIAAEFAAMEARRLASHIATEIAQTQATAAGTAARSGMDWWGATQSVLASSWAAIKNIGSYALTAIAATYASIAAIPFVGPFLAPAMAIGIGAAVLGLMGGVASASGGYDIPSGVNPMTQLHAREMVLPAALADRVRGFSGGDSTGGGSGGDTYNVTIHAMDGADVHRVLTRNPAAVAAGLKQARRDGHLNDMKV